MGEKLYCKAEKKKNPLKCTLNLEPFSTLLHANLTP